jgi:hypothetical protein
VFCRGSNALTGDTATLIASTIVVAEAVAGAYAAELAVTVTVKSLDGGGEGAV